MQNILQIINLGGSMDVYLYERRVIMIKKYMAIMLVGLMLASTVVGCRKNSKPADNESVSTTMEDIKDTSAVDETEEDDTSEITEETTTEGVENETTKEDMEEETSATEEITTEPETEPVTEPSLESETETENHSSEYEQEITTPYPTEAPTTKPLEPTTQPPTTEKVYYDPYTWEVISKEEYESIWDAINNPKPTDPPTTAPKENVYVFNDDGTIDFKKSNITSLDDENLIYFYESNEVKKFLGDLYYEITMIQGSYGMGCKKTGPTLIITINNEYHIQIYFDLDWNLHKGKGDGIISYYHYNLPIKEDW